MKLRQQGGTIITLITHLITFTVEGTGTLNDVGTVTLVVMSMQWEEHLH